MHAGSLHLALTVGTPDRGSRSRSRWCAWSCRYRSRSSPHGSPPRCRPRCARSLFHAFTGASWEVQSRDREGQLQDTMTTSDDAGDRRRAGGDQPALQRVELPRLLVTAFALNPLAAGSILVAGVLLFVVLRPLKRIGVRRAPFAVRSQVQYASGVNEAIRLAEETQVFGVAGAQRRRIDALIQRARDALLLHPADHKTRAESVPEPDLHPDRGGSLRGAREPAWAMRPRSGRSSSCSYARREAASTPGPPSRVSRRRCPSSNARSRSRAALRGEQPARGAGAAATVQTLALEDVSYAYRADRPVLSEISFEVERGEVVGIIGPTGAGKSTLIQILLRLRAPQQGSYLVNGDTRRGVRAQRLAQARRVRAAGTASAARLGCGEHPIRTGAGGRCAGTRRPARSHPRRDHRTGRTATTRRRASRRRGLGRPAAADLCLARALAAKPEVLVLDEPTSALDPNSEALIQESLSGLKHELTLFIIAHRMSTLDICDRVMVIIDGRLVGVRHDRSAAGSTTSTIARPRRLPPGPGFEPRRG